MEATALPTGDETAPDETAHDETAHDGTAHDETAHDETADDETADDTADDLDLELIERDLDGVAVALERLDAGTYWTDEVTGATIADEVLEADPIARHAG